MKNALSLLLLAAFSFTACFNSSKVASRPAEASTTAAMTKTSPVLPDFTVNSLDGKPVSLSQYRGKKIIILNVASKCGYTPQYAIRLTCSTVRRWRFVPDGRSGH